MDKTTKRLVVIAAGAVAFGLSSCSSNQYQDSESALRACRRAEERLEEKGEPAKCIKLTREDASKPHYALRSLLDDANRLETLERFYY